MACCLMASSHYQNQCWLIISKVQLQSHEGRRIPHLRLALKFHSNLPGANELTHWPLVTPYGDRDLGQLWLTLWLVAWRHQAITWTNVDLSTLRSYGIHPRALSWEDLKIHTNKTRMKFEFLKSHPDLLGTNELMCHAAFYNAFVNITDWTYYTPRTTKLLGGYTGFTPSVRPSVCPSVRPSVRPSRMPCPLCIIYSYGWILFILGTNDHYHERVCRAPWPLTLTYIFKVIWPWLRKSCPLCSVYSSGWILSIFGTNDHYH